MLFCVMAAAVVGTLLGYPSLVAVAAGGAAAAIIAAAFVVARPVTVDVTLAVVPAVVRRGEATTLELRAHAARGGSAPCRVVVAALPGTRRLEIATPRLARGDLTARSISLRAPRRGYHRLGPVEVSRADPLGLLRTRRTLGEPTALRVWPREVALAPLGPPDARHLDGSVARELPDGVVTVDRLREYRPGDDARRIHWPSLARTTKLMVKTFVDPAVSACVVGLDTSPSAYGASSRRWWAGTRGAREAVADRFERAVDVAASVVVGHLAGGCPVRLYADGELLWPAPGTPETPWTARDVLSEVRLAARRAPRPGAAVPPDARGSALIVVTGPHGAGSLPDDRPHAGQFARALTLQVTGPGRARRTGGPGGRRRPWTRRAAGGPSVPAGGRFAETVEIADAESLELIWPELAREERPRR
ncbi:DUF58 domain-containing protein [Frankia sp. CNm7]|uniref:DUF58 domain-containing protein n=1 Tax=Frankia nepalensis TaxID=1836974 RepID=A0A937RF77_9ACTN|nr:DUF58 domain-containing protein [Frankia nepalensis]MBL7500545.1 DUF58 domain-containing protein [Frankia nepalensis]MBL7509761.1 DUF58 domain-containing protein [Frankia nepalensis]MBL7523265.1 DUF58 domain-containing protein [Frankia nepalensis]MBL7627880.1 DUF58 domain-containing protein [Frankia nepalensis]